MKTFMNLLYILLINAKYLFDKKNEESNKKADKIQSLSSEYEDISKQLKLQKANFKSDFDRLFDDLQANQIIDQKQYEQEILNFQETHRILVE